MRIDDFRQAIESAQLRISNHVDEEKTADKLLLDEVLGINFDEMNKS